ncbi:MAG: hypothetical protein NTX23_07760, partial [Candidatus Bipolaricaulota bacterium]|nr:hypothetical protein [Candidatus Bipolaricaulota bacterium]
MASQPERLGTSVYVTAGGLPGASGSLANAQPVTAGSVEFPDVMVTSAGAVRIMFPVSTTVIVWTARVTFPHPSV